MVKIAVFVGSLRRESVNKSLAKNVERLSPEDVEFDYIDMDLPLYNQDLDGDLPSSVTEMKRKVEAADGVLFVTPEYNRSFSGVMKNAIDWASRPWGENSFSGKPAAIVGASMGALGTTQAQQALRNVALFLDMRLMGQPELYFNAVTGLDENGKVVEGSEDFLRRFAEAFAKHVENNGQ
ncbi:chromate reductase [Bifidobacterium commune]|uniref:NAD(P)H-dependent FMN reductase n=1 Tax=Bifidobacterium commune TaxID=1505727 RepID=A0A1C4H395_9BIFI|nr:NAD(P)H-dependent oxidoreductase [Bifidobacterium commune]MBB2955066.1 chromate reductase [Bifidobacterium commune]SCC79376.1 NAD(P)H-dependent FMN reductase [Bifidobacterium commune]